MCLLNNTGKHRAEQRARLVVKNSVCKHLIKTATADSSTSSFFIIEHFLLLVYCRLRNLVVLWKDLFRPGNENNWFLRSTTHFRFWILLNDFLVSSNLPKNWGIILTKGQLFTIHNDSAPRPQRSCFANPKIHSKDFAKSIFLEHN